MNIPVIEEHAILAPSSAGVWVHCPGSVPMQRRYPETSCSVSAMEGNAAHWVGFTVLDDFFYHGRKGTKYKTTDFIDKLAPNGVVITEEMVGHVEMYIRDVMEVSNRFHGASKVSLEHRVHMPAIHAENWGTLDCAVVFHDPMANTLVIQDFKYGWGIVEVWDNWQLIDYAIGVLCDMYARNHKLPDFIELRIVQPRPSHPDGKIRVQRLSMAELDVFAQRLRASAVEAMGQNPRCIPGPHCMYCTARHACHALRSAGYSVVNVAKNSVPHELDPRQLSDQLKLMKQVYELAKAQYSGLETQALESIKRGQPIPDWEHVRSEGREVWSKTPAEVLAIGKMLGKDLRKDAVITPKQAIKMGVPEAYVKPFSKQNAGEIKLVPLNLKRSAALFSQK